MRHVLEGQIVTLDGPVIDQGLIYIEGERIIAVRARGQSGTPPLGFEGVAPMPTRGTIYPGLIDLHGHLPYDIVAPWRVPGPFGNAMQWRVQGGEYDLNVQEPMKQLASERAGLGADIVRVVECKALLGGTTSIQGLRSSLSGVSTPLYTGLVRNVEITGHADLPDAGTSLKPTPQQLQQRMPRTGSPGRRGAYIVHLCEGIDGGTREEFEQLNRAGLFAAPGLVCIHCLDLRPEDHQALQASGAATVWSPTSNLLLYGETLAPDVLAPDFLLGKDWSPTGGRNLLQELKVAWLSLRPAPGQRAAALAESLVHAVTRRPALRLGWQSQLGQLKAGLLADLLVIDDDLDPDPYMALLKAHEGHVRLVMIGGRARAGERALMASLVGSRAAQMEHWTCAGRAMALDLHEPMLTTPQPTLDLALQRLHTAAADIPAWLAAASSGRPLSTPIPRSRLEPLMTARPEGNRPAERDSSLDHAPESVDSIQGRAAWAALVHRSHALEAAGLDARGVDPGMGAVALRSESMRTALPTMIEFAAAELDLDLPAMTARGQGDTWRGEGPSTEREGALPTRRSPAQHLDLAAMTVIDDERYFDAWNGQKNLPEALKGPRGLAAFYPRLNRT